MKTTILFLAMITGLNLMTNGQWSGDPSENTAVALAAGEEAIPKIATTPDGITYIAWFSNESGNYHVRLQKFDLFGNIQWPEGGILISDNPSMTWLTDWDMTVDMEGGAVLTFQDIRNGNNDAFVYRISFEGEFLWGEDGIELSNDAAFDAAPKVCVTAANNTVVAWQADEVIRLQKISPGGDKLWGNDGLVLSGANTFSWPQPMAAGTDDIILKYFEDSGPIWAPTRHVFAQRYDADGNPVWADKAVISNAGGISAWTQVFSMVNDGSDGFYIAWHDDRDNDMHSSVFVQHISADGEVQLGDDGTEASTQLGRQNFYPHLALPEGSDDIFVYWNEMDSDQNNRGIYGQKLSPAGERLWSDNGKVFIEITPTNVYPFSAGSSGSDMVLFYEKFSSVVDAGISAMCIDLEGGFVWPGQFVELCTVLSEKVHSVASGFVMGQWISAWEDDRNGNRDIYAQNIQLDGSLGPLSSEPAITIEPDTLFIEVNGMTYNIHIINTALVECTIDTVYADSEYWDLEDLPEFPFMLPPLDSLTLTIPIVYVGYGGQGNGYVYDTLFAVSTPDTATSIIAFNLEVIPGISAAQQDRVRVYPNPSASGFVFEVGELTDPETVLQIYNAAGDRIREFRCERAPAIFWNGCDDAGRQLPAGVYVYRLLSGSRILTGKVTRSR